MMKLLCALVCALLATSALAEETNLVVDVRFSTNAAEFVSAPIGPKGTGLKDFDKRIPVEGMQDIGTGTYVSVKDFTDSENGTFSFALDARDVRIRSWQTITTGGKSHKFPVLAVKEVLTRLEALPGVWVPLGPPFFVRVRSQSREAPNM
jgi:hypothetical protein